MDTLETITPASTQSQALQPTNGGFLFATFKGESYPAGEQVYFGLSEDGYHWQALNNAEPILVSELGAKGVRDPFLLRSHDGERFYLIATDLNIYANTDWKRAVRAGSRSIVVWESEDLVNWSEPQLVPVAAEDAGCTWAPEAVYDEDTGEYLVFWASTSGADDFAKHRIWASHTADFKTFSDSFVYIDKPHAVIDTNIVRDGGHYYRFSKDEEYKAITLEVSKHLAGPWQEIPEFSLARLKGYEGPQCFPLGAGRWCLLLDYFSKGEGYHAFVTDNLAEGHFEKADGFSFPFRFRHGSLLAISEAEKVRLATAFANNP
jgi:hypothetical protein